LLSMSGIPDMSSKLSFRGPEVYKKIVADVACLIIARD